MNDISIVAIAEGNVLIKLVIAHLLADFVFQTGAMAKNKKWLSLSMALHIAIVYVLTALLTGWWGAAVIIAVSHYVIDGLKMQFQKTGRYKEMHLFLADQALHLASLAVLWTVYFDLYFFTGRMLLYPINNYEVSLIVLGYLLVTSPLGFLIGLATRKLQKKSKDGKGRSDKNGFWIGVFERIIILTFMLLQQYEAIGFLITGKSIIRFSTKNEDKKSEYVLLGTMISYGITIILGIVIRILL